MKQRKIVASISEQISYLEKIIPDVKVKENLEEF